MFYQLAFDEKFLNVVDEVPDYWTDDELPEELLSYIYDDCIRRPIYSTEDDSYYCSKCCERLDSFYCKNCSISFYSDDRCRILVDDFKRKYIRMGQSCSKDSYIDNKSYYYVFDTNSDGSVFLYVVCCQHYSYWGEFRCHCHICKIYYITKEYVRNVSTNSIYYYHDLDLLLKKDYEEYDSKEQDIVDEMYSSIHPYFDDYYQIFNIDSLNNSIYHYTNIWTVKDIILKNDYCTLYHLVYLPIHFSLFEYLVKLNLTNLAFSCDSFVVKNKSFKGVLGIGKDYYSFMRDNNITYQELCALKLFKLKDVSFLKSIFSYCFIFEYLLSEYHIDPNKIISYFHSKGYDYEKLLEYRDYIHMLDEQGFDIHDNTYLFPNDLDDAHNNLACRLFVIHDDEINKRISLVSSALNFNIYEDEQYIIIPARSIQDMVVEAKNQHNCLLRYCDIYSRGKCQIFFMRRKNNIDQSYITIELDSSNRLVQARTKYNELPSEEVMNVIFLWLKKSVNVVFE